MLIMTFINKKLHNIIIIVIVAVIWMMMMMFVYCDCVHCSSRRQLERVHEEVENMKKLDHDLIMEYPLHLVRIIPEQELISSGVIYEENQKVEQHLLNIL